MKSYELSERESFVDIGLVFAFGHFHLTVDLSVFQRVFKTVIAEIHGTLFALGFDSRRPAKGAANGTATAVITLMDELPLVSRLAAV